MKIKTILSISSALFLLVACSKQEAGLAPSGFGNSVQQNIAAQIVNPDAENSAEMPVFNGARTAVAQKRYVTDTVEKAKAAKTSSVSTGSGGGGK